jgi:hypothetical protein
VPAVVVSFFRCVSAAVASNGIWISGLGGSNISGPGVPARTLLKMLLNVSAAVSVGANAVAVETAATCETGAVWPSRAAASL